MGNEPPSLSLPSAPYRGIEPFRFVDQPIFSARTDEVRKLVRLITIYRGIFFYGESGAGKSSLINAGLIPALRDEGFAPERVRVQPIAGQELVIERIALTDEGTPPFLPSRFAASADQKTPEPARVVLSVEEFVRCIGKAPTRQGQDGTSTSGTLPVLFFDQFEELITLFEEAPDSREKFNQAREIQGRVVEMLLGLLGDPNLSIKLVLSFREDYLAKVSRRFAAAPQLGEQAFRISSLPETVLRTIIRGPFESASIPAGHFTRRLSEPVFDALESSFRELSDTGTINLTEVQIACLALWENEEEEKAFLKEREPREAVRRLFGNYLDRALNRLEHRFRKPAITALTFLVTSSGTRNIVSEDDLLGNVVRDDHLTQPDAREVLKALSRTTRLVFRQTRGDSAFYEISSEFLIPWITEKRQAREKDAQLEKQREELARLEEKRLHEAESERVKLLLEKRKRERIFGVTVFVFGVIILTAFAALGYAIYQGREVLKEQVQRLVETGRILREKAKGDLVDETNPIRNVTALRSLSAALNLNPQDTEAAKMARDLLLQRVWCPPAAPEVRYQGASLLAATFAPGGMTNEIFSVVDDGQLLFWNGRKPKPSPVRSLFKKPIAAIQHIVLPAFASFSPDGQWLLIIPPTLVSAANAEAAPQVGPQQGPTLAYASSGHDPCSIQTWRWSAQNHTYEPAGPDLQFQRLRGSRIINFVWSPESDRLVIVNTRMNESECVFFQVNGNTFQELLDQSKDLNRLKVVALAFAPRLSRERQAESIPGYEHRKGIAVVSVDSAAPAVRRVSFIDADDLQVIPNAMNGGDSIRLAEGFQPNGVAFGPGNNQLTLTSWGGIRILNLLDGSVTPISPPTFQDQFIRMVVGPRDLATRLVATSLYGRVHVAKASRMQEPAEPVVFRGSIGIPQFSSDGQRLLILSGGVSNVFDTIRLIDVSPLYRPQEAAPETFEKRPAPPWLADIASAVSAVDTSGDGSLLTLEMVRQMYPKSKAGDPYEAVWKRFFPNERTAH